MEVNKENKKKYDAYIEDYEVTYQDHPVISKDIDKYAKMFALRELIFDCVKAKDYAIVYGKNMQSDIKIYDIILTCAMSTGEIGHFYVITEKNIEDCIASRSIIGEGDVTTDKIEEIKYIL